MTHQSADNIMVWYSPSMAMTIDLIRKDGRGHYGGRREPEILAEYPDAIRCTLDEASVKSYEARRSAPKRITRERYWQMLECLFPEDWQGGGTDAESFKLSERTSGEVTQIFCRLGEAYYELLDTYRMRHTEIVRRCREVLAQEVPT